jgi:hypothetical protein
MAEQYNLLDGLIPQELEFKDDLVNGRFGTNGFEFEQDVSTFLAQAKMDRDVNDQNVNKKVGRMRKVATIPDIVAIEILTNHHLDLHDTNISGDPVQMKKVMRILQTEYPHILSVSRI